jgi:triose/dihydroxyacetone kinase / FAD-AMP lyase (cyclizing)
MHPEKADRIKLIVVEDDVAVGRSQSDIVGRRYYLSTSTPDQILIRIIFRGLAGTVLVYKIAGALAMRGESLDNVYRFAQWVSSNLVTVGVGLERCHVC